MNIFIFRRDLRLHDNTGLRAALSAGPTLCCFFLDPRQTGDHEYKSNPGFEFMKESLLDLKEQLQQAGGKLVIFQGEAHQILKKLIADQDISGVYVNRDFTPFSTKRDEALRALCNKSNVEFFSFDDLLLHPPEQIHKADGKPYTVYTPFYKYSRTLPVSKPKPVSKGTFVTTSYKEEVDLFDITIKLGGRSKGLKLLENLKKLGDYKELRDFPHLDTTSHLSPHHKFGTISCRETYWHAAKLFGEDCHFIKELYWRDFYTHIAYHFPKVFGNSFQEKYSNIHWENDKKKFLAWCEGKTGFPIVDAGMRQLNETGDMHNRVRMIVASFLTKDLHIDWRWGEKYFAQKLLDYDPCVNNGSWQWAASTGCDAQPYFRVFNPWLQQKKFDNEAEYIKKWVPELANLDAESIHNLDTQKPLGIEYTKPIVNHKTAREKAIALFKIS